MSKMKTLDHRHIEYNDNSIKFSKSRDLPMTIKAPNDAIVPGIAPDSIEFLKITINENNDNLVICKVKYDSNGKHKFEIRLVSDLLFSQLCFVKQLSESITEHKIIKQHLDQVLQLLSTVCV